jgi:hypothetical protein
MCLGTIALISGWGVPTMLAAPQPVVHAPANAQDAPYTIRLYPGSCDALDMELITDAAPAVATPGAGTDALDPTYSFELDIESTLPDLVSEPHAIAVEMLEGDLTATWACGQVAGDAAGGKLVVGLASIETGDLVGVAVLREYEQGTVRIEAYLLPGSGSSDDPGPEATDDGGDTEVPDGDDADPEGGV